MEQQTKILLVDDDTGVLESLSEALKDSYYITTARSGEEAIDIIKKESHDLVILDIRLSGIDGLGTLKIIKSIDSSIPIIILSGIDTMKIVISSIKLGAADYIGKPFDINDLKKIVKESISNRNNQLKDKDKVLSVDIEQFIENNANNMSKKEIQLKNALQYFREKYIDFISNKFIESMHKNCPRI